MKNVPDREAVASQCGAAAAPRARPAYQGVAWAVAFRRDPDVRFPPVIAAACICAPPAATLIDFSLPPAADSLRIIRRLQDTGFVAYLAGGCVRDALLGRTPKDFDVATDATPQRVRELFGQRRTQAFGAAFGVIGVRGQAREPTEVATFRSDGTYSDGRRPDHVRFGTAEQDAQRRDYTINGLFYDPVADRVVDHVGGRADLARRLVRAIGDPRQRIGEDKLRMLRAVRFASTLGFMIDYLTATAIRQYAADVTVTSAERIGGELRRMLGGAAAAAAVELLADTHLLRAIWPSLQRDPQRLSEAIRLASAVQPPDFTACVAAILAANSADTAAALAELKQVSAGWRLSNDEQEAIGEAIRHHRTVLHAERLAWSEVQPVLVLRWRDTVLAAAEARALVDGQGLESVQRCRERIANWSPEQLNPAPLLDGQTLIELGYRPGPPFKLALQAVRNAQLDGRVDSREQAVELARLTLENRDSVQSKMPAPNESESPESC